MIQATDLSSTPQVQGIGIALVTHSLMTLHGIVHLLNLHQAQNI